jgi:CBS domain-containing protein
MMPLARPGGHAAKENGTMASIQKRVVRNIVSLDESASCADAARYMAEHGIGSLGVTCGASVIGLVTERDLLAAFTRGLTTLGEAMPADPPAVSSRATDWECAQLMRSHRTRHLVVKERAEIVGMISMLDLVDLVVEEKQSEVEQLESYIRGGRALGLSQPTRTIFEHEAIAV